MCLVCIIKPALKIRKITADLRGRFNPWEYAPREHWLNSTHSVVAYRGLEYGRLNITKLGRTLLDGRKKKNMKVTAKLLLRLTIVEFADLCAFFVCVCETVETDNGRRK